jgi:hypothetical protein
MAFDERKQNESVTRDGEIDADGDRLLVLGSRR